MKRRSMYYFYTRAYENSWLTHLARMREVRGLGHYEASLKGDRTILTEFESAIIHKLIKIKTRNFASW